MPRYAVILNPISGRGRGRRLRPRLEALLQARGVEYELRETRGPGDAVRLAREARQAGAEVVVAVGGDGTVHEVVNGLEGDGEVVLGVLPIGSGNDFAKLLDDLHKASLEEMVDRLLEGREVRLDLGRAGDRWFANAFGGGLDAQVAEESLKIRRLRGVLLYLVALLRVLRAYRPLAVRVETGEGVRFDGPFTLFTLGNGRCQGGGFWLTPLADPRDGLLDLVIAGPLSIPGILGLVPRALRGTHLSHPAVEMVRTEQAWVEVPDRATLQADGELIPIQGPVRLEVRLYPRRLRVRC